MLPAFRESHEFQKLVEAVGVLRGFLAGDQGRQQDVLLGGERRYEVEKLEHEPHMLPAEQRQLPVRERRELYSPDECLAGGGPVQGAKNVEQGTLARTGRTHDRREFAVGKLE